MSLIFRTEIRELFGKEYFDVFLPNMVDSGKVEILQESINRISWVNESKDEKYLTTYPAKLYTAKGLKPK